MKLKYKVWFMQAAIVATTIIIAADPVWPRV